MFEEEESGDYSFARGKHLGRIKGRDADFWVIPEYWFQDNETGEFINMHTGVVVNRKCYMAACGVMHEYSIEPEKMLCGEIIVNDNHPEICVEAYTHPKAGSTFLQSHRSKSGHAWPSDDSLNSGRI